MTDQELKRLKDNLWHSADMLRASAHLAANKYGQPILGLIFLRYADILFKQHKKKIDEEYNKNKGTRMERSYKDVAIEQCGFFLPECAYYDYLNDALDNAEKAVLVKKAMEAIEKENAKMDGVLPKEVYGQLVPEEEPELLSKIIRVFKDIPEDISIDIFGQIYEYFLGNFALSEGQAAAHSTRLPRWCSIWLKCCSPLLATRNSSTLPVVREVCLCRQPAICTGTMRPTMP